MSGPCDGCLRRSWLIGRLAGHLEVCRAERAAIRGVLALSDAALIERLGGSRAESIGAEWEGIDPAYLRERWTGGGHRAVCRCQDVYPAALLELPDPPAVLHLLGGADAAAAALAAGAGACVSIVGARRASTDGTAIARELGRGCTAAGLTVVSGMALGIDAAAHDGALDACGATVAVLACGPERAYPPRRARLHRQIAERGVVLAELPPGTPPYRWAFPARNRIIAALSGMTVVVEAAERSGSLITAEIALELGRAVGAVPGPVTSWRSRGTNALLRDGAQVVRDARDVLDDLCGAGSEIGAHGPAAIRALDPGLQDILDSVAGGTSAPAAGAASAAEAARILEALAELEILGHVVRMPGGRWRASDAA